MTSNNAASSGQTIFRPSVFQRALFVAIGIGGLALALGLALTDTLAMGVFGLPAVIVVFEGLRAQVEVDLNRHRLVSSRAFRHDVVAVADIVNVRVPPWGPIALTLRPGAPKRGGGIWPGQVLTGLYADHRGRDRVANDLASVLNVPVVSVWPGVRSDQEPK